MVKNGESEAQLTFEADGSRHSRERWLGASRYSRSCAPIQPRQAGEGCEE
jgi:hypothetical protein